MPPTNKKLIIISAGQFGREVLTWVNQAIEAGAPWVVKGFLDDRANILNAFEYSTPILGNVEDYQPSGEDVFLSAVGDPDVKARYCELLETRGAEFATLIHPTALIGHNVRIGEGCILGPFTQLSCDIHLGRHVVFGTHSNTAHDTFIGDFTQICGSCEINGNAKIGSRVFVGSHATILPKVSIGDSAFIGAGSVVLRNVRPFRKVFGNPAIVIQDMTPRQLPSVAATVCDK